MLSSKFKSMRRKGRVRARLKKDQSERIRLTVYRSNNHVSAQLIDDKAHKTLASVSTLESVVRSEIKFGGNILAASLVGKLIAQRGIALGIEQIVFDRGEYLYHGRVKALADAARSAGLKF